MELVHAAQANTTERDTHKCHGLLTSQSDVGVPLKSREIQIGQKQDGIAGTAFWEEPFEMNLKGSVVESKQTEI